MASNLPKVLFAAVTHGRNEASIHFAVNALRLQTHLIQRPEFSADMHFFPDVNTALNALYANQEYDAAFVVDTWIGFSPEFVHKAVISGKPLVTAVYPLPGIDWERVKRRPCENENPQFSGNAYNVDTTRAGPEDNFMRVAAAKLGAFVVRREVLSRIIDANPDIKVTNGALWLSDRIVDGNVVEKDLAFCDMYTRTGGKILADLEFPVTSFGPCEFTGCVGLRHVLR